MHKFLKTKKNYLIALNIFLFSSLSWAHNSKCDLALNYTSAKYLSPNENVRYVSNNPEKYDPEFETTSVSNYLSQKGYKIFTVKKTNSWPLENFDFDYPLKQAALSVNVDLVLDLNVTLLYLSDKSNKKLCQVTGRMIQLSTNKVLASFKNSSLKCRNTGSKVCSDVISASMNKLIPQCI